MVVDKSSSLVEDTMTKNPEKSVELKKQPKVKLTKNQKKAIMMADSDQIDSAKRASSGPSSKKRGRPRKDNSAVGIGLRHVPSSQRNKAAVEPTPKLQKTEIPIEISDSPSKGKLSPDLAPKINPKAISPQDDEQMIADEVSNLINS